MVNEGVNISSEEKMGLSVILTGLCVLDTVRSKQMKLSPSRFIYSPLQHFEASD